MLSHSHDSAKDPKAKASDAGNARREQIGRVPDGDVVFALLEDEVLGQGHAFVDCEPVALTNMLACMQEVVRKAGMDTHNQQHEIL